MARKINIIIGILLSLVLPLLMHYWLTEKIISLILASVSIILFLIILSLYPLSIYRQGIIQMFLVSSSPYEFKDFGRSYLYLNEEWHKFSGAEKMLKFLLKKTKAYPMDTHFLYALAEFYVRFQKFDKALFVLSKLKQIKMSDKIKAEFIALNQCLAARGIKSAASQKLKSKIPVTQVHLGDGQQLDKLTTIYIKGAILQKASWQEVEHTLDQLIEKYPKNNLYRMAKAEFLIRIGSYEKAAQELNILAKKAINPYVRAEIKVLRHHLEITDDVF